MDYELIKPDEQDAYDPAPFFSYARLRSTDRAERDPDVGDAVHFWDGSACAAAMILRDDLTSHCLRIFWPDDVAQDDLRVSGIEHSESKATDTWHWPCGGQ